MPTSLQKHAFINGFLMILIAAYALTSCKDKNAADLLQENMIRLQQQNEYIRKSASQQTQIDDLLHNNIIVDPTGYLKIHFENFHQTFQEFLDKIVTAQKAGTITGPQNLFKCYSAYQNALQQIESKLKYPISDIDINGFMNLKKESFTQKYLTISDSLQMQNRLLLLETDLLLHYNTVVKRILASQAPDIAGFNTYHAIATTSKCIYKRGDSFEIIAFIGQYASNFEGSAIIEGQHINAKSGIFTYSRSITESPGIYSVPIKIAWLNKSIAEDTFPAIVTFKVE